MPNENIVVVGASGGLGSAFVELFSQDESNTVYALSRTEIQNRRENVHIIPFDYCDESSIQNASEQSAASLDRVIVATGILHNEKLMPEKSLRDINSDNFVSIFHVNTFGPMLIAKYFLPKLNLRERSVFAALSARVGSIEDNHLGGWYAYRASKTALNMLIKTASIEIRRRHKQAIVVALHPGTVETNLSKPFQHNVPKEKCFSPEYSAKKLVSVMDNLCVQDSGKVFAWDEKRIPY